MHRRTSWVEQALHREGPKGLGIWDLRPLAILFKEVGEIFEECSSQMCGLQASGLDYLIDIEAKSVYRVVLNS